MKNTQLKETAYKLASNELLRLVEENFGRVPRDEWADRVLNLRDSLEADTTPQPAIEQPVQPCGGCGESNQDKRCIGCAHVFEAEQKQGHNFVKEVLNAAIASTKGAV